eukprot:COSAG05_NODE_1023_length_6126_cov_6.196117_1_plen_88_part_00
MCHIPHWYVFARLSHALRPLEAPLTVTAQATKITWPDPWALPTKEALRRQTAEAAAAGRAGVGELAELELVPCESLMLALSLSRFLL